MMNIYDISQKIFGCEVYPGDPEQKKLRIYFLAFLILINFFKNRKNIYRSINCDFLISFVFSSI